MRQFWVNTLVKFWDSPLWLRKLFTGIGTIIVFKSSNKRCREYLESIVIDYIGWQVPRWNELLRLTETAHRQMPQHKYIAYDFALTKNGWVMIEGNWGQYICQQTATQSGAKKKFRELINS